ncbi:hypothetical protein [Streptomyces mirabilis]|uniref:hypothetical protein n=1 Tax=Streptomyces mirabilis TaxID=68239 RepID=UPI0036756FE4
MEGARGAVAVVRLMGKQLLCGTTIARPSCVRSPGRECQPCTEATVHRLPITN